MTHIQLKQLLLLYGSVVTTCLDGPRLPLVARGGTANASDIDFVELIDKLATADLLACMKFL